MAKWEIKEKPRDHLDFDTPSTNTVQSDNLSAIERFVREIIGNSRDSCLDKTKPVKIEFSINDLSGKDKENFVNAAKFYDLKDCFSEAEKDNEN